MFNRKSFHYNKN